MEQGARPGLGIALIVLMGACFAALDTTIKYTGVLLPILLMLSVRYTFQAFVMLVWLVCSKTVGFRTAHPRFQILRGSLLLATSAFSFFGLQHLPVAEFTAINMLTPLIVTLLAAWLLHDRVSPLRWALVGGGFAGALIVIRPGSGLFGWEVLFPLAGALCYASFQLLTSRLAALESPYTTHFYTGLVGTAIVAPVLLFSPIDIDSVLRSAPPFHIALLLAIGLLGTVGHLCLILALSFAPTATLMPFTYLQIAIAAAIGWLVFRYVPDSFAWLGMGVIAVCGAGSAWLNVRDAQAQQRPTSAVSTDTIAD